MGYQTIDLRNRLVLFPKLTQHLMADGRITLKGKNRSDYTLIKYIYSADEAGQIPHVMSYDKQSDSWAVYNAGTVDMLIMDDLMIKYDYDQLCQDVTERVVSFLSVVGSAEIVFQK